jgi:hypothetical protein
VRQQSKAAKDTAETRRRQRWTLLVERGGECQACPVTPVGQKPPREWSDVHEILTRARGGDPTDMENQLCVCGICHKWITEHEEAARALGLVRARTAEEHAETFRPWLKKR